MTNSDRSGALIRENSQGATRNKFQELLNILAPLESYSSASHSYFTREEFADKFSGKAVRETTDLASAFSAVAAVLPFDLPFAPPVSIEPSENRGTGALTKEELKA